jgi:FAD/FMN-containing dehydrogenase
MCSASLRQAPCSTALAISANSMSVLARQAFSRLPGIRPMAFGHVGDGNIHFNLTQPAHADTEAYLARWQEFNDVVHGVVRELQGSISAEHGVGMMKRDEITHYKSPVEIELMRRVKRALDPGNIMNPGKLVSV